MFFLMKIVHQCLRVEEKMANVEHCLHAKVYICNQKVFNKIKSVLRIFYA